MTKLLIVASLLLSFNAFAHVTPGDYKGLDQNGNPCSFTVGDMFFENNMHHPLTERLRVSKVSVDGKMIDTAWTLGHPPVVNTDNGTNRFNHDIFQQIIPNKTGASSLTLLKAEEKEEEHGPVGIIFIEDNYSNKNESFKITCLL